MTAAPAGGLQSQTVNLPSVLVDSSQGQHLFYRVTVQGANPAWVFSCEHRDVIRKSTTEPGHPKAVYEWTMTGADLDSTNEIYSVTMVFGTATRYDVITELRDAAGMTIELLTQLTFEGGGVGDFAREELQVLVV